MATSSPHASIPGCNRAIRDTWRANLAAKGPFSRRGTRNHAWREDVASAARPFSGSSLRSGGTGFAPCDSGMRHAAWPNGLCALRRGPGLLSARAPPCHLACARRGLRPLPSRPRSSPPSYTCRASLPASRPPRAAIRRVAHCSRGEPPIGLFPPPSCCPRRRIAPTDARSPAPPEPQPEPTESRPRANRASPTRGDICAHPRPATRCISPCRVGPAAVPVIPAKWCGDTIAHTRKLRF